MCLYSHTVMCLFTSVYGIDLIKEQRPDLSWKYETADSKLMKLSYNNGSVLPAPSARLLRTDSKCKVCSLHLNITVHELFGPKLETFYISPVSPVSYLEFKTEVQLHEPTFTIYHLPRFTNLYHFKHPKKRVRNCKSQIY